MNQIELKFSPAYFALIMCFAVAIALIVFIVLLIVTVRLKSAEQLFIILLWAGGTGIYLYNSLRSIKREIRVSYINGYFIFEESDFLIKRRIYQLQSEDIKTIWIHSLRINFIPMGSSFMCQMSSEKFSLFSIAGERGYLDESSRRLFLQFLYIHNDRIQFGL